MTYVGPKSLLSLNEAARLDSKWMLQPKIDGCYATVYTDEAGCISGIYSRTGKPIDTPNAQGLMGCRIMPGVSVLVGELEDHTEWGCAQARMQGFARVHLFDVLVVGGRGVADLSYARRRGMLQRYWHEAQYLVGDDRPWRVDEHGIDHDSRTGRFCKRIPGAWRRAPVVPQWPANRLHAAWDEYVGAGGEGLVAVNMDAPAGARGAKRKIKERDEIDGVIAAIGQRMVTVRSFGLPGIEVGVRDASVYSIGQAVSLAHDGRYNSGTPRFPRIVRVRADLA